MNTAESEYGGLPVNRNYCIRCRIEPPIAGALAHGDVDGFAGRRHHNHPGMKPPPRKPQQPVAARSVRQAW